jgi:hypothetical protein
VPRFFNQGILAVILGPEAAQPAFEWLSEAHFARHPSWAICSEGIEAGVVCYRENIFNDGKEFSTHYLIVTLPPIKNSPVVPSDRSVGRRA